MNCSQLFIDDSFICLSLILLLVLWEYLFAVCIYLQFLVNGSLFQFNIPGVSYLGLLALGADTGATSEMKLFAIIADYFELLGDVVMQGRI